MLALVLSLSVQALVLSKDFCHNRRTRTARRMRTERYVLMSLVLIGAVAAIVNWRKAAIFRAENDRLRADLAELEEQLVLSTNFTSKMVSEMESIRKQRGELMTLRNEVTQLRTLPKDNERLGAELQRLQSENKQLRTAAQTNVASAQVQPNSKFAGRDRITRDSWAFAGYASPEDALVSAIWAMKEGNPRTYLDSLSPQEQQRMAENWKNKSEQEIAQKHQSDVSQITGVRILDRKPGNDGEMLLSVYLEGQNQLHTIMMNQNGQEWKFGGFVRPPAQQQAQTQPQQ